MQNPDVRIITDGLRSYTSGLRQGDQLDIEVTVNSPELVEEGRKFLEFVVRYLRQHKTVILPGQTMNFGYWLVRFVKHNDNILDIWEYNANATEMVPGATLALTYDRDQSRLCEQFGATFTPPIADKLAAISPGVLEGEPVHAIRYPSPSHMFGWWFVTDSYNGDIKTMKVEHLYHVTAVRPELAQYMALPYGYRVDLINGRGPYFDEAVARRSST